EEAPATPARAGDIPIDVPASAEVSGLPTEDDVREGAIDLEEITRGNFNPFRAELTISKNIKDFQPLTPYIPPMNGMDAPEQMPMGSPIPREAFAEFTRIDLVFKPDRHMILEYNIRIRDIRGIMHSLLLAAETEKPGELQMFMPTDFGIGP